MWVLFFFYGTTLGWDVISISLDNSWNSSPPGLALEVCFIFWDLSYSKLFKRKNTHKSCNFTQGLSKKSCGKNLYYKNKKLHGSTRPCEMIIYPTKISYTWKYFFFTTLIDNHILADVNTIITHYTQTHSPHTHTQLPSLSKGNHYNSIFLAHCLRLFFFFPTKTNAFQKKRSNKTSITHTLHTNTHTYTHAPIISKKQNWVILIFI